MDIGGEIVWLILRLLDRCNWSRSMASKKFYGVACLSTLVFVALVMVLFLGVYTMILWARLLVLHEENRPHANQETTQGTYLGSSPKTAN